MPSQDPVLIPTLVRGGVFVALVLSHGCRFQSTGTPSAAPRAQSDREHFRNYSVLVAAMLGLGSCGVCETGRR